MVSLRPVCARLLFRVVFLLAFNTFFTLYTVTSATKHSFINSRAFHIEFQFVLYILHSPSSFNLRTAPLHTPFLVSIQRYTYVIHSKHATTHFFIYSKYIQVKFQFVLIISHRLTYTNLRISPDCTSFVVSIQHFAHVTHSKNGQDELSYIFPRPSNQATMALFEVVFT